MSQLSENSPRIVSLFPAATEILCVAGLQDFLVGVSHACDFPAGVADLPRITRSRMPSGLTSGEIDHWIKQEASLNRSVYELDRQVLQELEPSWIALQSTCAVCAISDGDVDDAIHALVNRPKILRLDPQRIVDVFDLIAAVHDQVARSAEGKQALDRLRQRYASVTNLIPPIRDNWPRVLFLEWLDPPFSAGHWNPELVELAGGTPLLSRPGERSKELTWHEVANCDADVVIAATCGHDLSRGYDELRAAAMEGRFEGLPAKERGALWAIDGSMFFNRPGPRLVDSLEILAHLLHPGRVPRPRFDPPLIFDQCVRRLQSG